MQWPQREEEDDAHRESDGENKAGEDFHNAGVGSCQPRGTTLEDFREQTAEGKHCTSEELGPSITITKTTRKT